MAIKSLLVADDIADRSTKGRLRSNLIRENAIELAKKMNLEVRLIYVANLSKVFLKKKQISFFVSEFNAIKASIESKFAKAQVPAEVKVDYGVPAEEILNEIRFIKNPQLLVLATQGKTGLSKMLLGSVAEEVIRNSSLPIFVLGPAAQEKSSVIKLDSSLQVLFLTDFGEASAEAETFMLNFCKELNCSVLVVHGIGEQIMRLRQNLYGSGYIPFNMEDMFNQMVEDAQRELQRKTRLWIKGGVKAEALLIQKEEPLEKSLKTKLRSQVGLVIMGTHGRNKIITSFLGSNARKILLESPVPVVIIRSLNKQK